MFDTANKFKHISMLLCQPKACLVKRYLYKHRAKPSQNTVTCIKSIFFSLRLRCQMFIGLNMTRDCQICNSIF